MTTLVVGEALIDLIVRPDGSLDAVPGGGPYNAARTLGRLGADVAFLGGVSDDVFGRRIAALLTEDAVATPLPTRQGRPTTLALAELDAGGAATYEFYVPGTSAAEVLPDDVPAGVVSLADVVHVGTLGLAIEPLATTVETLLAELRPEALLFLDPNCRPAIIPDEAVYRARLHRVLARADVVKVSGDDLAYLEPAAAPIDAARRLLDAGPAVVLFTDGGEAVRILTGAGEITVPVAPVDVVDTVGAGDAFGGAFLAFWGEGGRGRTDLTDHDALRAAVERAVVVAGITCTRAGADPPWRHELPD